MIKSLYTPEYGHFRILLLNARISSNLTQEDVAIKLGRPQSFVAKYEGGERRLDVIEFIQVCNALAIDPKIIIDSIKERVYT